MDKKEQRSAHADESRQAMLTCRLVMLLTSETKPISTSKGTRLSLVDECEVH
jgi:hypothetical protein